MSVPVRGESAKSVSVSIRQRLVINTRRNDRIAKVERRAIIGADWRLEKTLADSEDSSKLNASFIERLNLTIRQGSAYLSRGTICHARWKERLEDHLELIRCHYDFVRPHRALKFGRWVRTPAMQAGLTTRQLTFREIFYSTISFLAKLTGQSGLEIHHGHSERPVSRQPAHRYPLAADKVEFRIAETSGQGK